MVQMSREVVQRYRNKHRERINAKQRVAMRERRAADPEKDRQYQRQWYSQNKEAARGHKLKQLYSLTLDDYERMVAAQGGRCAACGIVPKRLVVDHCHTTGKVRGILCCGCNRAIGHARDDLRVLASLVMYLSNART